VYYLVVKTSGISSILPGDIRQSRKLLKFACHFREPVVDCSGQSGQESVQTESSAA
jgi:hypothetical protein